MKITFLTIFPQLFDSFLAAPIPQRAVKKGALEIEVVDIRDFSPGSFRHIDDSPFGGGPGMVMRCQPVLDALRAVQKEQAGDAASVTAALSPAGAVFTQKTAHRFAGLDHLILICGHYEGMDERIYRHVDEEVSIGDFILTGGELARARERNHLKTACWNTRSTPSRPFMMVNLFLTFCYQVIMKRSGNGD